MKWWLSGLVLAAAAASAFNVIALRLENLLDPRWPSHGNLVAIALVAIGALTIGGVVLALKRATVVLPLAAIALIIAAGFVPRMFHATAQREAQAAQAAATRALETKVLAEIEMRRRDLEARIAAHRPYEPEEAREFLAFVTGADLTTAGGPDHSARTIPLLQRALETRIVDANAMVKEPRRADLGPEPLFLNFYRRARPAPERPVLARDWKILLLLAANGADLSIPAAAPLVADLRKTATPVFNGLYIELK